MNNGIQAILAVAIVVVIIWWLWKILNDIANAMKKARNWIGPGVVVAVAVFVLTAHYPPLVQATTPAPAAPQPPPLPAVGAASFPCPVTKAVITQPFGPSNLDVEPRYNGYDHYHVGIDLAKPAGTPIVAAEAGILEKVDRNGMGTGKSFGYGNSVWIQVAQNREELYGHFSSVEDSIQVGSHVDQGQIIGRVGSTGFSTGPHLHFGVFDKGIWVNPAPFFQNGTC